MSPCYVYNPKIILDFTSNSTTTLVPRVLRWNTTDTESTFSFALAQQVTEDTQVTLKLRIKVDRS